MEKTKVQPPTHSNHDTESALAATQENLDKVREILFGAQVREQDRRFHDLEKKLGQQFDEFRQESRRQTDMLETFAKKEIAAAVELLKVESAQRTQADTALAAQLKETASALQKTLAGQHEQHADAERALREELLQAAKASRDELAAQVAAIKSLVEKHVTELTQSKTDRSTLAALLTDVAQRINNG